MTILDLLKDCVETDSMLFNDDYALSMGVIELEMGGGEVFVWCRKDGRIVGQGRDGSGFQRVVLSPRLVSDKGWYLNPSVKPYR